MTKFKRLSAQERKNQICEAAKNIFLEKGFSQTTMEDIVRASGMSKGGVYNYYKNLYDIFHDIMKKASDERYNKVSRYMKNNPDLEKEDIIVEATLDKLFDYNEYKPLYAMFLLEKANHPKLQKLYLDILEKLSGEFLDFCKSIGLEDLTLYMNEGWEALLNSVVIGTEILGQREAFEKSRPMFRIMIRAYFRSSKEENFGK